MIDYGRVAKGDVLEVVGRGARGYAAVGDRVRVVHVGLDNIVVEDKAGRWAKFIGNQGASRLRAVEATISINPAEALTSWRFQANFLANSSDESSPYNRESPDYSRSHASSP